MNNYEVILIINATPGWEAQEQHILQFFASATDLQVKKWGLKKFAYPIEKQTSGYYYQLNYQWTALAVKQLTPKLNLAKGLLRFLIVNLDQEKRFRHRKTNSSNTLGGLGKTTMLNSMTESNRTNSAPKTTSTHATESKHLVQSAVDSQSSTK